MKKGFTLVELAIVLVIIGLLVGGILIGQTLIESAKIQSFVKQIAQFDAAVMSFQSKYKGLPGDARAMGGNGNNFFDDNTMNSRPDSFSGEIGHFWSDLSLSGLTKKNGGAYVNASAGTLPMSDSGATQNVPVLPLGEHTVILPFTDIGVTQQELDNGEYGKNFYQIFGKDSQLGVSNGTVYTLNQIQAAAIDSKMDDGIPHKGDVLAQGIGGVGEMGTKIGGNTCPSYGPAYSTTSSDIVCPLVIKMFMSR